MGDIPIAIGIILLVFYVAAGIGVVSGIKSAFKRLSIDNPFESKKDLILGILLWPWVWKTILKWSKKKEKNDE